MARLYVTSGAGRPGFGLAGLVWLLACVSAGGWLLARSAAAPPAPARHTKPIEDVKVGDWVLAADQHDPAGRPAACRVVDTPRNYTYHVVRVRVEGGKDAELKATRLHPFWVDGRGWTDAKDLRPGDALRDEQGRTVRVAAAVVERQDDEVPTYNLTVDGRHTYFVDAAPGLPVLVHNVEVQHHPNFDAARRAAMEQSGLSRVNPSEIMFGQFDATGTYTEFYGPNGEHVNYDGPHTDRDPLAGHDKPHVGSQTPGKRYSGGGAGRKVNNTYDGEPGPARPCR